MGTGGPPANGHQEVLFPVRGKIEEKVQDKERTRRKNKRLRTIKVHTNQARSLVPVN
jgi:hypothetical protein